MEQFSLEKWLKNKSRKVVTRDGREVEILKTNRKDNVHPIIFTVLDQNNIEQVHFCNVNGICTTLQRPNKFDLFFADEEEELSEFENKLLAFALMFNANIEEEKIEYVKECAETLLDLARKEIEDEANESLFEMFGDGRRYANNDPRLDSVKQGYYLGKQDVLKSLPKWKKDNNNLSSLTYRIDNRGDGNILLCRKGYAINIKELLNLPKEE